MGAIRVTTTKGETYDFNVTTAPDIELGKPLIIPLQEGGYEVTSPVQRVEAIS